MKNKLMRKLLVITMSLAMVIASVPPLRAYGEGETPAEFF